jgi:hypothetical protein
MYSGKLVFAQIMEHLPLHTFRRIVARYAGERKVKSFSCLDQFLCRAFAQLTFRESLRDIEACLRAQRSKLYHLGIRSTVARHALANANAVRDWRMYADVAQGLIAIARPLYVDEPFGVALKESVYALDTTTIDLCLAVFSWAPFRLTKAAVKLHTLLDLRGNIPAFIHISDGKMHEVNILDQLLPEPGAFYVMDRGFLDFERLHRFHEAGSFFVTRGKSNLKAHRRYSHPVDRTTGLICDQTVVLTGFYSHKGFAAPHSVQGFRDRQDVDLSHQQLHVAGLHDHRTLSMPLASRVVLQMDQAASSDQGLLRHLGERGEVTNLDRRLGLRPGCHRQEASEALDHPL